MASIHRRKRFLKKCQAVVDDVHDSLTMKKFVEEDELKEKYGTRFYRAFRHQLAEMGVDLNVSSMTDALEWMYFSQHFKHKASQERRLRNAGVRSWLSFRIAVIALLVSLWQLIV